MTLGEQQVQLLSEVLQELQFQRHDIHQAVQRMEANQQEMRQIVKEQGAGIAVLNSRHEAELDEVKKNFPNMLLLSKSSSV